MCDRNYTLSEFLLSVFRDAIDKLNLILAPILAFSLIPVFISSGLLVLFFMLECESEWIIHHLKRCKNSSKIRNEKLMLG